MANDRGAKGIFYKKPFMVADAPDYLTDEAQKSYRDASLATGMADSAASPVMEVLPNWNRGPALSTHQGPTGEASVSGPAGWNAPRGPMLIADSGGGAAGPMAVEDRQSNEDIRRGYSAGNVTANQYRAKMGFMDAGAKRERFQIAGDATRNDANRRSDQQQTRNRMQISGGQFQPISLGGGGVAQLQRDGTLKVHYPPAGGRAAEPVAVKPGETLVDPVTGRPLYNAPPGQSPMQIVPEGAMGVQDGKPVVTNAKPVTPNQAEEYHGPMFFDSATGFTRVWNPNGGQYGKGGYDMKEPKPRTEYKDAAGKTVATEGSAVDPAKLPQWEARKQPKFIEEFKAKIGRDPTPTEIERAKGKYW